MARQEVDQETRGRLFSFTRAVLSYLYQQDVPKSIQEMSDELWRQHRTSAVAPSFIRGAVSYFVTRGFLEPALVDPQKFLMTEEGKRVVEEIVFPTHKELGDIKEIYDEKNGVRIKPLIPPLITEESQTQLISEGERINSTFVHITWEKATQTHGFHKTHEVFLFLSQGKIILEGEEQEVKPNDVVTLPPGETIKLIPTQESGLSAILLTSPQFDEADMFIVEEEK